MKAITVRQPWASLIAVLLYAACIPLANWFIQHVGRVDVPGGPHVVDVGFGYAAPSGVLWIGLALVARDIVQRTLGRTATLAIIAIGAALSYAVAPSLAWASAAAFVLGEFADFVIYTPLERRHLRLAVLLSGLVGALIDSLVFLHIAFGSTAYWQGNMLGKVWMSVATLPFIGLVRRAVPDHAIDTASA